MSFKDFRVLESLGKGSFASVYKVIRKSDNKVYALKRVKIAKMSKKEISDALNEIRFLASIRHKNIVGFLEAFLENNETELCIVMEYCGCGDLAQKVERYKRRRQHIDEDVIWRYMIQCLKALENLHAKGICHRDIKVANSFLAEDGSIKIGDMNVSKRMNKGHLHTQIGTPYYMSPEIWNNRPYDASSDIWSLGCMMYELCALRPPFQGNSFPELKRAVISGRFTPIPRKYSDGLHKVIGMMLRTSARERPSAERLLKSNEMSSKLKLDDNAHIQAMPSQREMHQKLMETIRVPHNLRRLNNGILPKPCYPDARPNSPTSWTVAEQAYANKKKSAAAAKAAQDALNAADSEGIPPPPPADNSLHAAHAPLSKKEVPLPPSLKENERVHQVQPLVPSKKESKAPSAAALADYYVRRPLAPSNHVRDNVSEIQRAPVRKGYADYRHIQSRYAQYNQPKVKPTNIEPSARNQQHNNLYAHYGQAGNGGNAAGRPSRVQYQHRMW
jgi:NIMA (never in mitosis gene a)-related kinase